ncbi:DNA-directed RNA polymerase II subunit RPB4 [Pyxicephalus adspersus]
MISVIFKFSRASGLLEKPRPLAVLCPPSLSGSFTGLEQAASRTIEDRQEKSGSIKAISPGSNFLVYYVIPFPLLSVPGKARMAAGGGESRSADVEEDASQLLFPKEFESAETLLNSEVHMLLEHRKQQNESAEEEQELSEVFMKTLNYTARFSRFKNRETIASVRRYIGSSQSTSSLAFFLYRGFVKTLNLC